MIYFLTIVLFIIGVLLHVMSRISKLRKKFPELAAGDVFLTFFREDWDSLIVSGLVLLGLEVALYIIQVEQGIVLPAWLDTWGMYLFSFVMGYAGQRLVYKYLNTAEGVLERKVENLNQQ